ncbi:hypothetical protein PbJCM13498_24820 [Prolixibacter bellariivorans]|uniref:Transposase IS200-like domain-containing protein n=1 Tax=Prolixibacter bellariivorans TaxID=314319 RepID=A0A5M4B0D7_9BACT|nr:hypothetical protein [Prolixibacter bellariivorans]GET33619.1 hypothetical protein PbJCM13498_24820 [Prolixibacter bellariivorans]
MQKIEPIISDRFYHIYNRGINGENLFAGEDNYFHFLRLYDKFIHPIADTYAWVLMPNHFHLLVRIKEEKEFDFTNPDRASNSIGAPNLTGFQNLSGLKPPFQHFSNLFNAYTKAFNKRHARHGALFERPFKRKLITDKDYLRQAVMYIHNNPIHHGFCDHPLGYPWSSYAACVSVKPTRLHRKEVLEWFDDRANFIAMHRRSIDREKIEQWLKI